MSSAIPHMADLPQRDADPSAGPRFWGLSPVQLHDRCWASFGVQVVRRGTGEVQRKGPQFYLLVEPNDLIVFNLAPLVEQFNWLKPSAIRLRITDSRGEDYNESILTDPNGYLVAVRRGYQKQLHRTHRCWITPNPNVAQTWAEARERRRGWKAVSRESDPARVLAMGRPGRVFDASRPDDVDDCLALLQHRWNAVGAVIDGVYEIQPGVWVHESVEVPEGVRFVGTVWIGAEQSLNSGEILVGPGGRPDAPGLVTTSRMVPWEEITLARWRLSRPQRQGRARRVSKRLFDITCALIGLACTLPFYPLVILMIVIEDGWPAFFAHRRQTLRGREFPCLKFRSMCKAAEGMKSELTKDNVCDGPQFYMKDDPRLLKSGKIMRKLQIDELPQFWNVLVGHMSIVGPRPSPESENQYCPTWREARLSVRPGLTGLWQVRRTRRPQTDFQEWIRYDLEYLQHQSWRLDLWIIWQTVKHIIQGVFKSREEEKEQA